jgi:asparagine synthase (glutamine-hydrolysing)
MCGIAGAFEIRGERGLNERCRRMADAIRRRGPDDAGCWCDLDQHIGLGHRRLAIVDLSAAGHQPMHSSSGRYVISFNGEIYNHESLRRELEAGKQSPGWRGHSDTETLLAGFDAWGIQPTVERTIGMFAFAIWDRECQTLTLARDRMGEKPLYYGWQDNAFLFGSELKALRAHPAFQSEIDRGALCLLLRHNCIPAPYSVYKGIGKLPPGCLLAVSLREQVPKVWAYWSGVHAAELGVSNIFSGTANQAVDNLELLLLDAVGKQMMSDVPLGAFLSGGIDSSTVVALMQAQSPRPVKTFSIGFHEADYNEAQYAKVVAGHLGTDHTELYVTPEVAMAVIPRLPDLYDEPFSDSSQIPTYLVSQLAREHVTVSLSGDGGDELFCGYNRYKMTARTWRKLAALPMPLRKSIQQILIDTSPQTLSKIAGITGALLPTSMRTTNLGDKLHKGAEVMTSDSVGALYLGLVSHWRDPASVVIGGEEPTTLLTGNRPVLRGLDEIQQMMALDLLTYLPDDILTKVDRAAMGVSLETRVPLLDHRVVEFAWRLPLSMKIRDNQTKWILRQVLYKYVPEKLIQRPKSGFSIPIDSWLRGSLRDWAEDLLDEGRLQQEGFFHPAPIRKKWAEHLSGRRNWQQPLWDILMFQSWLENQRA